jgi:hypothetical protein
MLAASFYNQTPSSTLHPLATFGRTMLVLSLVAYCTSFSPPKGECPACVPWHSLSTSNTGAIDSCGPGQSGQVQLRATLINETAGICVDSEGQSCAQDKPCKWLYSVEYRGVCDYGISGGQSRANVTFPGGTPLLPVNAPSTLFFTTLFNGELTVNCDVSNAFQEFSVQCVQCSIQASIRLDLECGSCSQN